MAEETTTPADNTPTPQDVALGAQPVRKSVTPAKAQELSSADAIVAAEIWTGLADQFKSSLDKIGSNRTPSGMKVRNHLMVWLATANDEIDALKRG